MAHLHVITDSDNHFIINTTTRNITNANLTKLYLIKGDHNSERFTFELPRTIEGHDMSTCNRVEVHYINIDGQTRSRSSGLYLVDDFQVNSEDSTKVVGSWLVSKESTRYAGTLNFVLRFICSSQENIIDYSWSTSIYSGITIQDGICNTESFVGDYSDILQLWWNRIQEASSTVFAITDDGTLLDLTSRISSMEESITSNDTDISTLQAAAALATGRLNELEDDIQAEAYSRSSSDTALGTRIDGEVTAREDADTALSNRITAIENDNSDETLNSRFEAVGARIDTLSNRTKLFKHTVNISGANYSLIFITNSDEPITVHAVNGYHIDGFILAAYIANTNQSKVSNLIFNGLLDEEGYYNTLWQPGTDGTFVRLIRDIPATITDSVSIYKNIGLSPYSVSISGTTNTIGEPNFKASGSINIGIGMYDCEITTSNGTSSEIVSYNSETGSLVWRIYSSSPSTRVNGTITYYHE